MGKEFKKTNSFNNLPSKQFVGPEYYSKGMLLVGKLSKPLNRLIWFIIGKKMGAEGFLRKRPYDVEENTSNMHH